MFRPDRTQRGEDPLLLVKLVIFCVAATVAVVGMATQRQWVIFGAIIILAVGFLLRFVRRGSHTVDDDTATMHARHELGENDPPPN